ncbi:Gfo/Idh/MocA family protein [Roseofilum casamattae]|uniref:Gfo/Idh/MocA family oxidoreductase n=1 Tax=Roseofilum casamattae BLCC-M143 TaxID=3022442 RepID=A0ABT7BWH8_9CYAN|nr:Gfo/Idh/MocA family oxidoreductase [Roseofilum casamattae]MDJ1182869.1 Gfo/Idh/MocA family oxidoreductase [Roseofilum casamattae BLCC-M143]
MSLKRLTPPVRAGIIGTGFAAGRRARALQEDDRAQLVAAVGHQPEKTEQFARTYGLQVLPHWQDLVALSDLDLVVVSTINRDCAAIAKGALQARKHVVVEYPLALNLTAGRELLVLAQNQQRLLHVEHIEVLGELHQVFKQALSQLGEVSYARYSKIAPKHPAPQRWSYQKSLFGFPLVASLSCIHRLTDAFGMVSSVSCQTRYWPEEQEQYGACLSTAQLTFKCGTIADIIYAKGDRFWHPERRLEARGSQGSIICSSQSALLIQEDRTREIAIGSRRGLFAEDTRQVLNHLIAAEPLYITAEASLYALQVACAAEQSAATGRVVWVDELDAIAV